MNDPSLSNFSSTSPTTLLNLLTSIRLSHPAIPAILQAHKSLANPSHLPTVQLNKFLNRLSSAVVSQYDEVEAERRAACEIARVIVEQDEEGQVIMQMGKRWVGSCLSTISVSLQFGCTPASQGLSV